MDLFVALATFSVFDGFVCCFDTVFSVSVGYVYFFHFVFTVHWLDFFVVVGLHWTVCV